MNYKEMEAAALMERRAAIVSESETATGDALAALESEMDAINAELEARKAAETARNEARAAVANGAGTIIDRMEERSKNTVPTISEYRNSTEYINAYANYIRTGRADECRALLTANASPAGTSGPLPVPEFIETGIRTAWENDPIMSRVRRTFVRGNLKVSFERSSTPAAVHAEGAEAPTEEVLVLGMVALVPETIKKWITFSTETESMGGEEFLRYIYDELTYRIVRLAAANGIADIVAAPAASTASAIGVPAVQLAPSTAAIPTASAYLSDNAVNPVVILNRLSEVAFIAAAQAANFAIDPWAGLPRVYTTALPAYNDASANDVYAIVGDLNGLQYNYPDGDGVAIVYDNLSKAEEDMVKVVGRQYAAHGVTTPGMFVKITK